MSTQPGLPFGTLLRRGGRAAGLTQQDLAGTTYSKSYLSAVERGRMTPSFQALSVLAERLGVTLSYLLGEEPSQPPLEMPEVAAKDAEQDTRVREAERLVRVGRFEEAITLLKQIGQRHLLAWAREVYAQSLADQGRYQEAYEQAIQGGGSGGTSKRER